MPGQVLDVERGIERLMGNGGIYFNALKRFATHIAAARAVSSQLATGDHAGACRTIHTLKGAAGLLCADEVHVIAGRLEAALVHGHAIDGLLEELEMALQRVQARIAAAVAAADAVAKDAVAPSLPVPPQETMRNVLELLDRLAALFDEDNSAALDMLDKYGTVLEKALGAACWEAITAAVQDCDFERAFIALQAARSAGGRSLPDRGRG